MKKIMRSPRARLDVARISEYLAREAGVRTGLRFLECVEKSYITLARLSGIGAFYEGSVSADLPRDLRVWQVAGFTSYLVFYREKLQSVEILRVVHGSQDLDNVFSTS